MREREREREISYDDVFKNSCCDGDVERRDE